MDDSVHPVDLMKYLPRFYDGFVEMCEIQDTIGKEMATLRVVVDDHFVQRFVRTATWGLNHWERELGLTTDRLKSYEHRRKIIQAKLLGSGTTTAEMIRRTATVFLDKTGRVEVVNLIEEYKFTVRFVDVLAMPLNMPGLIQILEEIKPAHLAYRFEMERTYRPTIEVQSHYDAYTYDIPFAGTLYCGTWPETATWGELYTADMELSNDCKARLQRPYRRAGETVAGSQQVFKNKAVQISNELAVHEENYRETNPYPLAGEQPCGTIPETVTWGREIETTLEIAEETQVTAQPEYKRCGVTRAEETKR